MAKILVSGLINIETTLKVEKFPIKYFPVDYPFFGVNSTVSGVGYNISKALSMLGHSLNFLSMIGRDMFQPIILNELRTYNIGTEYIRSKLSQTAQSVILYDGEGQRQIHVDLKDIQNQIYPLDPFKKAMVQSDLCVLCNINFSRPFLEVAKQSGKLIATDVHAISDIDDPYNADYMAAADILFMSHENLQVKPETWIRMLWERFNTPIVVIGAGKNGAILGVRDQGLIKTFPSVTTRPVINTIGAGDALFSSFIHTYLETQDPILSIQKAIVFASYKIGSTGAAEGFLNARMLDELYQKNQDALQVL